jgi:hypothetical protein
VWPPSSSTNASAICRAAARSRPRSTVASVSRYRRRRCRRAPEPLRPASGC